MFGSKVVRSERSFSLCLAEELLRAELKRLFGDHVKIFSINIKASPPSKKDRNDDTVTDIERASLRADRMLERYIKIEALFGPMERLFPENPPEDQRRRLYRINAECRLFSISTCDVMWYPHFMRTSLGSNSRDFRYSTVIKLYENGKVDGDRLTIPTEQHVINPCLDMSTSQSCSCIPQDWTPKIDG